MSEDILAKREEAIELFDEYKNLLTDTQRNIFLDYYMYDLSLSEIAENNNISRAAASDSIHKSLAKLFEYEEKLQEVSFKKKVKEALDKNDFSIIKEVL